MLQVICAISQRHDCAQKIRETIYEISPVALLHVTFVYESQFSRKRAAEKKFNCRDARENRGNWTSAIAIALPKRQSQAEKHRERISRKLTGVLDVHGRRRAGSRDDNRRRHLGVQGGEARVRHVVDEISAVVSARTAHFQFILTGRNRHFRVSRPQIQPHPPGAPIIASLVHNDDRPQLDNQRRHLRSD